MQNEINVGDQNTQQNGQNPVNQSVQTPKSKINHRWIYIGVVFLLLALGGIFYFLNSTSQKKQVYNNGVAPTQTEKTYQTTHPIRTEDSRKWKTE